ncbi:hypothetical protein [Myxococcus sp. RHSTA-1-4]|uniref:hypothetical protein n=1 Tax=Myxococcus sp. RHSTA-1-4 TaxID=2874601 RepID=UPI001CBE33C8|nr:hypothetical protein [Myxococcus sp. RHSTA-1-4]MBZ4420731.1 hypothetical protein [Myxococcus sp. RHSTA-1-4]
MSVKLLLAGRRGGGESLFSPPEEAQSWLRRVEGWFHEHTGELLEGLHRGTGPLGAPMLRLRLHPAASEISLVAASGGRLVVSAETSAVGPGYHVFLCDTLKVMGEALGVTWADANEAASMGDPTGYFHTGEAGPVEVYMLASIQESVARVLRMRRLGESGFGLSMRFGHTFEHPGALLTPLGPRDERWLRNVYDDPRLGIDVFPWWKPGIHARTRLNRALCRLWTDVVWRPPLLDEERGRLRDVARLLELAWREDPALPYPWREWQEVLGYLGVGGTLAEEVRRRAAQARGGPPMGYRRGAVQVALPEGWEIRIPGSLAEAHLQDGTWVARDHRRSVRFVPLEDGAEDSLAPTSAERRALELEHHGKRVSGRASLHVEPGECRLTALCSSGRRRALCVVSFDDPDEQDWALGTWRSLDHAAAA